MAVMVSMMAMMMMYIHPWPIPSPLSNALLFSEDDSVGDIFSPSSTSTHPCLPSYIVSSGVDEAGNGVDAVP